MFGKQTDQKSDAPLLQQLSAYQKYFKFGINTEGQSKSKIRCKFTVQDCHVTNSRAIQ
jgi:hypothetical protein